MGSDAWQSAARRGEAGETQRYTAVAIALHWLTAALIAANLLLAVSMVPLPISPRKLHWYQWHKWVGVTVFLLTWARLGWRWRHAPPPLVAMAAWQVTAARVSHALLYVLLVAIPLSGWLYSSATGVQVVYLDLVPLPDLLPKDKALAAVLKTVHVGLNLTLVAVVCVHAAAAVRHHVVERDDTLARMVPGVKPGRAER
jgi:cytochrome b561